MKRFYYVTQNINTAQRASERLHEQGVTDWNFHVLGKDKANLIRHHLHSTTPLQELDIIRSTERGIVFGFALGILLIGLFTLFTSVGAQMTIFTQLALIVLFSLFGAWLGGLMGISSENYKIRRFHNDIEAGLFVLMIDAPGEHKHLLQQVIDEFDDIRPAGEDSTWIMPFDTPVAQRS